MSLRKFFVTASLVLIASLTVSGKASADWLFTPFIGSTFGGSANIDGSGNSLKDQFERRLNYGASLAWVGAGAMGFEFDFGYAPNFFRTAPGSRGTINFVGDGNVATAMANLVVGAPRGGVRPYVSGGVGLLKSRVTDVGQFFRSIDSTDFGFDAGAGLGGFFTKSLGLRGDIRFFRSLHNSSNAGIDLELGQFKFWRGTVGLSFRF
jgi:opacity protein-like surface antigen